MHTAQQPDFSALLLASQRVRANQDLPLIWLCMHVCFGQLRRS